MSDDIHRIGIFLGGMRCGSTAFRDYIQQHPQVCMHKKKDPHFFSSDQVWAEGLDAYKSGWEGYDASMHSIAVESSTHYTKRPLYPDAPQRMASLGFDLRLVYAVRDPIDRVESHLVHNAGKGYFDPDSPTERKESLLQAINVSNYSYQLAPYENFFPPEKLLVIVTETFISDPVEVLSSISGFFGIDSSYSFEKFPRRERKFKKPATITLSSDEEALVRNELLSMTKDFVGRYQIDAKGWRIFN